MSNRTHPEPSEAHVVTDEPAAHEEKTAVESLPKRVARKTIKAVAVAVGAILFLWPVSNDYFVLVLGGAMVLLLIGIFLWHALDLDDASGYWPEKPKE